MAYLLVPALLRTRPVKFYAHRGQAQRFRICAVQCIFKAAGRPAARRGHRPGRSLQGPAGRRPVRPRNKRGEVRVPFHKGQLRAARHPAQQAAQQRGAAAAQPAQRAHRRGASTQTMPPNAFSKRMRAGARYCFSSSSRRQISCAPAAAAKRVIHAPSRRTASQSVHSSVPATGGHILRRRSVPRRAPRCGRPARSPAAVRSPWRTGVRRRCCPPSVLRAGRLPAPLSYSTARRRPAERWWRRA